MSAVVEAAGPWPASSPHSNGIFIPLDVDKYDGLAVVVGYGPNGSRDEGIGFDDFQEMEGTWQRLGGGSGGPSQDPRDQLREAGGALHLQMGGSSDESLLDARRKFSRAILKCGSDVAVLEVHRRHGVRSADVSTGPGWLAVLWVPDDPATVNAFSSDGTLTFRWTSPPEAA